MRSLFFLAFDVNLLLSQIFSVSALWTKLHRPKQSHHPCSLLSPWASSQNSTARPVICTSEIDPQSDHFSLASPVPSSFPQASSLSFPMVSSPLHTQRGRCRSGRALSSAVKLINVFQWSLEQAPLGLFSRVSFCHEGPFPQLLMAQPYLTIQVLHRFHLLRAACS